MARLQRLGLLHKVAAGYYVVVPQERVGTDWRPTVEAAAAAGIATAAMGAGRAVLMGVSATRMHNVIPRASPLRSLRCPRTVATSRSAIETGAMAGATCRADPTDRDGTPGVDRRPSRLGSGRRRGLVLSGSSVPKLWALLGSNQ
jgi:hypothetical protein